MAWLNTSSTQYSSSCGSTGGFTPQNMLDGSGAWYHLVNEEHSLILDYGTSALRPKIKTKNVGVAGSIPDDIDVFVTDDTGDWGTAVETGIDITSDSSVDWTERILTTHKSGRYVKLTANTAHGSNYLGWGSAATKVFDVWSGALPKRWTETIQRIGKTLTNTSTSYTPTDGTLGWFHYDPDEHPGVVLAYIIASLALTGAGESPATKVQLYDRTNSAELGSVTRTSDGVSQSIDFAANLPTESAIDIDVRIAKGTTNTNATIHNAVLVLVKEEV
jgi:hypothetical protein